MKKIALLLSALTVFPAFSDAAEVPAPVQEIMDATVNNWTGDDVEWIDIFDPAKLDQLYSQDFVAKYKEAAKHPAVDEGISPFDYDVIVNGQDACPLEDVKLTPQTSADGKSEVAVTFRKLACADGPEAQTVSSVRFQMVTEGGKPLVDDIMMENIQTKEMSSLKAEMVTIAKGE